MGHNSSVGIATRYLLVGLVIQSRWEARFFSPDQTGPGTHPASYKMSTGSTPLDKGTGAWCRPPTPI